MARRPPSPAVNGVAHRRVFDGENMGRYKFPSTHSSRVVSCACNVIQNRVADTSRVAKRDVDVYIFSAASASASRTSLLPAARSGCCSRSLASSGLGPSSG